ncbi:MAG: hypothetical protein PWQ96_644 [Clostridia bacterium]|jgi:hypothetical protein|nr:hypothetical protein [Clostridiales bacterium]MDK2985002.1 hypothetical protein [Clostridia bacterium]
MSKCEINPGICGLVTTVEAKSIEGGNVTLKIISDCPNIQKVAEELVEINPFDEIFKRAATTKTYEVVSKHSPHPSCPVPSGILKAVEVEAGLALPKDVSIKIEK